jgi:hypothetical protein
LERGSAAAYSEVIPPVAPGVQLRTVYLTGKLTLALAKVERVLADADLV